jgi:hypothetical protein
MPNRTLPSQETGDTDQIPMSPTADNASLVVDRERIAQRAYERFEQRGREAGRDQEDWFEAERELNRTE